MYNRIRTARPRDLNNEDYFLSYKEGYKYILKETPNVDSLAVVTKRNREASKAGAITLLVFGILFAILIFGLVLIVFALSKMEQIDKNNKNEYECIYYDDKKKTIIVRSFGKGIWYELPIKMVRNIFGSEGDGLFGLILVVDGNSPIYDPKETIYLDLGYATQKEKEACIKKMADIRKDDFIAY